MDTASQQILLVLEHLVKLVPIGTNLALLQLMWAMLTGNFLPSRGAVHTALHLTGFKPSAVRRSWRALRYGVWSLDELLSRWQTWVARVRIPVKTITFSGRCRSHEPEQSDQFQGDNAG